MDNVMLTTKDNPYNPFTQWENWKAFDDQMGYHTCEYLDRLYVTSPALSEEDDRLAFEAATNSIIKFEPDTYELVYAPEDIDWMSL